jgi:hypothetical protein
VKTKYIIKNLNQNRDTDYTKPCRPCNEDGPFWLDGSYISDRFGQTDDDIGKAKQFVSLTIATKECEHFNELFKDGGTWFEKSLDPMTYCPVPTTGGPYSMFAPVFVVVEIAITINVVG